MITPGSYGSPVTSPAQSICGLLLLLTDARESASTTWMKRAISYPGRSEPNYQCDRHQKDEYGNGKGADKNVRWPIVPSALERNSGRCQANKRNSAAPR
jgi:hypothetical protein